MTVPLGEKKCTGCKEVKPFSEYRRDVHKKDKLTSRCKECHRGYYRTHRKAILEKHAEYYAVNRQRLLAEGKRNRLRRLQARA